MLNLLKNELAKIYDYEKADIHKNKEAVTLKLNSYRWNFDIVPCFLQCQSMHSRKYYLIPDVESYWNKSDTRI